MERALSASSSCADDDPSGGDEKRRRQRVKRRWRRRSDSPLPGHGRWQGRCGEAHRRAAGAGLVRARDGAQGCGGARGLTPRRGSKQLPMPGRRRRQLPLVVCSLCCTLPCTWACRAVGWAWALFGCVMLNGGMAHSSPSGTEGVLWGGSVRERLEIDLLQATHACRGALGLGSDHHHPDCHPPQRPSLDGTITPPDLCSPIAMCAPCKSTTHKAQIPARAAAMRRVQ